MQPLVMFAAALISAVAAGPGDVSGLVKTLQAVGPEGKGHAEAAQAWAELARADAVTLPAILAGLDGANPLAANWIRTAVDAVAERQLAGGGPLPAAELEKFVLDRRHAPQGRRLAYEWLLRVDPKAEERLIPGMLDDPSLELRRDAVVRLSDQAEERQKMNQTVQAVGLLKRALTAARDPDQVRTLAARLRKLDVQVDLARHFGFLVNWQVIGPFDNTDRKGYETVYPPERQVDLKAEYPGKHGPVKWVPGALKGEVGQVDLNKSLAEEKQVLAYATAEFVAAQSRGVQFRLTTYNAVKLWLNGRLIDQHPVYHSGSQMDQFISRGTLQAGRNVILLKVCQNEQTQEWARVWQFQLRVCDELGTAVLSEDRE